jgi:hypothetical protein
MVICLTDVAAVAGWVVWANSKSPPEANVIAVPAASAAVFMKSLRLNTTKIELREGMSIGVEKSSLLVTFFPFQHS